MTGHVWIHSRAAAGGPGKGPRPGGVLGYGALSRIGVGHVYTIGLIEALVAGVLGIALLGECVAGTQATACPDSSSA